MFWNASAYRANRRSFLAAGGSLAAAAAWASRAEGVVRGQTKLADYPFRLGVASGDPSPDGFVIWTRLAPKPLEGGGMPNEAVEVAWQVAEDEQMTRVVRQGKTVATGDWGHSVHVEVEGLRPDRWYFYQFKAAGEVSPVGRSRTFPAAESNPARLRFAFASCQHYESGYYTAYEHMVREDLDLIAFLGDYIYESAARDNRPRRHNSREIKTLADYRNRYALYKSDPLLRAAHQRCPWLATWDDHEVENNYAGGVPQGARGESEEFLKRRANAYQAYYEHMPLRRAALPKGPNMRLYRQVAFGRLANFFVLDTRQYRTDQPCGGGKRPPCDEMLDPRATILGDKQEAWLLDGMTKSPTRWNVLAQQVLMAWVDRKPGEGVIHSMDKWSAYERNRRRVLRAFYERKISNPIVLTGDIHSNWANDLLLDFDDLDSRAVASEFVGTSISSSGNGRRAPKRLDQLLADNPFVKFHNAERGYVKCEVTPGLWRTDYKTVEYVTRPGAALHTRASFVVEDQKPGLQRA